MNNRKHKFGQRAAKVHRPGGGSRGSGSGPGQKLPPGVSPAWCYLVSGTAQPLNHCGMAIGAAMSWNRFCLEEQPLREMSRIQEIQQQERDRFMHAVGGFVRDKTGAGVVGATIAVVVTNIMHLGTILVKVGEELTPEKMQEEVAKVEKATAEARAIAAALDGPTPAAPRCERCGASNCAVHVCVYCLADLCISCSLAGGVLLTGAPPEFRCRDSVACAGEQGPDGPAARNAEAEAAVDAAVAQVDAEDAAAAAAAEIASINKDIDKSLGGEDA